MRVVRGHGLGSGGQRIKTRSALDPRSCPPQTPPNLYRWCRLCHPCLAELACTLRRRCCRRLAAPLRPFRRDASEQLRLWMMLAATPSDGRRPRRCRGWLRCCQRPPRRRSASPTRRLRARHSTPACAATRGRFLIAASLPAAPRPLHPPAEANLPPPRRHAVADSVRRSLARLVDGPAVPTVHS